MPVALDSSLICTTSKGLARPVVIVNGSVKLVVFAAAIILTALFIVLEQGMIVGVIVGVKVGVATGPIHPTA